MTPLPLNPHLLIVLVSWDFGVPSMIINWYNTQKSLVKVSIPYPLCGT